MRSVLVVLAAGAPFNVAEERDPVGGGTVSGVYPQVVPPATGACTVGDACRCADRYEPATQCDVHAWLLSKERSLQRTVREDRSNPFSVMSNTSRPVSESVPPDAFAYQEEPLSTVGACRCHFDRPVTGLRPEGITVSVW